MGKIFGTDGIRDRAGSGYLTREFVTRVARAVGGLLRENPAQFRTPPPPSLRARRPATAPLRARGRVVIGRDTRASGPDLERWLVEGFQAEGVGAALAGVVTTPGVACLTRAWGAALGVVISASHNPAEDNGIKFFSPQGFKIPDRAEERIEKILQENGAPGKPRRKAPPPLDLSSSVGEYLDFLAGFSRPLGGMKIVLDCGHGAASALAGPLFERLGARPILLNASPDGRNINAGCGALHPEGLAEAVRREGARLGASFDGDADRVILADETGTLRDGDHVLALCATHLKERGRLPGNLVVSTVMANFGLERYLAGLGIALRRTPVGDRFVAEEMVRSGAVLGGEPAGHILFFDASPAGDGLLTTLRVLDILAERGEPLSRLALEKCPQVLLNVPVGRKPPLQEVPEVRKAIETATRALGAEGRVLVRYSGTENLCRVMVEGTDAALVDRLARDVADAVRRELS